MANLRDIHYSLNGETQNVVSKTARDISGLVKYDPKNPPEHDPNKWVVFKLVESNKKGGTYIPNIDDVVNPATGKIERIRLLTGVDSIWQKDQKDISPEYVKKNMRNIEFPRGVKLRRIKGVDKTTIDFMRISNYNIGNVNRIAGNGRYEFYEYDFALSEKEAFEKENFELEMALLAKSEKPEAMRKHASFLGIRMVNDTGDRKSDDGVRREYVMYAKRNPDYFKKTLNTPQIEISWLVRTAISESFIEIGREPGKIFWANGGGMICSMPRGENAQEFLTDLAMTPNEEGERFKEQLKQVVQ